MKKLTAIGSVAVGVITMALGATPFVLAPSAHASPDTFYEYTGHQPLSAIAPGTVLDTRTLPYHAFGLATPVTAVQLLYRTTDARQRPSVNVTSVLIPPGANPDEAVAFQSAYDSLNPADGPSRAIAGDNPISLTNGEGPDFVPFLAQRRPVIVADTEGPDADFLVGPVYGTATLDSIRAATHSAVTGLSPRTRIGLFGYSGGGLGTAWTAALAPSYAPDVNEQLVGAALGGLPVNPAQVLRYIAGSPLWGGLAPMVLIGISRAYGIDLASYLSDSGSQLFSKLSSTPLNQVLGQYQGLTWDQMFKPNYHSPGAIAPLAEAMRKVNLGSAPTPTTPMFIGQAANGALVGANDAQPGIGHGDGVTIAGDVRSLARQYCDTGNSAISYRQYDTLEHTTAVPAWMNEALPWLNDRFAGAPTVGNCPTIAPGNVLTYP
ncbi:putative secreted lipase [Nocardia nova SH22a]|uniref:Putative secreted lipase n=1 Tax=Nocardia nova SH22a TaxID=1415166 RepID=W5TS75_9NOCA|nr:lipase family protein [Nocardia nova]AHH20066.1 putative secreted lipase [Nocardia nova SH22a]